jgi:hypothetical protein
MTLSFGDSWNSQLSRFRSPCAYRGMNNESDLLETTLMRLAGDNQKIERHLLRNFKKYAHNNLVESDSLWHWLAVAQHHGLPTRLLDWTYSPLIAMHFATSRLEDFDKDGAIWTINYEQAHAVLPDTLKKSLYHEGANMFTTSVLSNVIKDLKEFDQLETEPFLLMLEPSSMNDRIINQYALFSIISDSNATVDDWAKKHPHICRKIIIPASLKWEVRDKLDQSNITERVLFPGLDGLTSWLKRHYSAR